MDMSGMDMDGMGGMDMGSSSLFRVTNEAIARRFWYLIIGATALLTLKRGVFVLQSRQIRRRMTTAPSSIPSRPENWLSQTYATATAICREVAYPQPWCFTGPFTRYLAPLPVGRWLILAIYWTVILIFLWSGTILKPSDSSYAYKWEKVGFRAAWVSIAQIPLVFLLSTKFNLFSFLTGISYERLNWIHRWTARTVFLTVIVHWSFFFQEWVLADFVQLELKMMPMVKYGFGAFAILGWNVVSGFGYFRAKAYELFVIQHICAAAVLIWLLYIHVPAYAKSYLYLSIAFVALDWGVRSASSLVRNLHLLARSKSRMMGYQALLKPLAGDVVRVTIKNVDFVWKPGQHVYLSIPRLRPLEVHPFTIASVSDQPHDAASSTLTLIIKAHKGFSRSLHKAALGSVTRKGTYRAFLNGPWGAPPNLLHYETVVLLATSSGASFTVPLLENMMQSSGYVRRISFHWIIRSESHLSWFGDKLTTLVERAQASRVNLRIVVHVTRDILQDPSQDGGNVRELKQEQREPIVSVISPPDVCPREASLPASGTDKLALAAEQDHAFRHQQSSMNVVSGKRPDVASLIRGPVEDALGETAVVVCGGPTLTARSRTFVASLSDERAVHKGTGAQGIYLFTETYGW
ncbi:hypothetical protein KC332_g14204 [Hortaea werneckii]|nr:hypothetical protein KC358_g14247 [Hortaea werneckii]KAI6806910.1 hypothetical protein KC350_g13957 [Hortaea werneckii]KAI6907643.1 hypothetical protein KC348_g14158 [Hortaea werneckii]KAI6924646.1 hypothetical protein KC341_g13894 [Hortaea werneckii]KAI6958291.1 hypothetical protein KC321_g14085 [Hortaea werneckii]